MSSWTTNRAIYLVLGVLAGVVIVAGLGFAFEAGSGPAVLLLDKQGGEMGRFTYPFTIQTLMWLLFAVGLGDVVHRRTLVSRDARALRANLLPEDESTVLSTVQELTPILDRARQYGARGGYMCELIEECILYFSANRSPGQTLDMMTTLVDLETQRLELRYSLLRYLAWVLPTIGFIGTVVGIAGAMGELDAGGAGGANLSAVTGNLSVAFNTTIIALCFSAVLVMLLQRTQRREEETLNLSARYCLKNLVNRLFAE